MITNGIAHVEIISTISKDNTPMPERRKAKSVAVSKLGTGAQISVSHSEGAALPFGAYKINDMVTVTLQCDQTEKKLDKAHAAARRLVKRYMKEAVEESSDAIAEMEEARRHAKR